MYKELTTITLVLTLFLEAVTSHGGHNEGSETKKAIQDAQLSYLCRGANGFPCNGHGSCSSGMCTCYSGYSGLKCESSSLDLDIFSPVEDSSARNNVGGINLHDLLSPVTREPQIISCMSSDENACSGHGFCQEGSCVCESGFSGLMCELSADVGFCQTYQECAECTAFMTPCPDKCSKMANFKLVFGFPQRRDGATFRECRFRNSDHNCTIYFKQEGDSPQGMKTIMVKACMAHQDAVTNTNETVEQLKDTPLQPDTSSRPSTSSVDNDSSSGMDTQMEDPHKDHSHGNRDDTRKETSYTGDSGTSFIKPEVLLVFGSFAILMQL